MEQVRSDMGFSMSAAFTIFVKKVSWERRTPFEISADRLYSDRDFAHLRRGVSALNVGKGVKLEPADEIEK